MAVLLAVLVLALALLAAVLLAVLALAFVFLAAVLFAVPALAFVLFEVVAFEALRVFEAVADFVALLFAALVFAFVLFVAVPLEAAFPRDVLALLATPFAVDFVAIMRWLLECVLGTTLKRELPVTSPRYPMVNEAAYGNRRRPCF